MKISELLWNIVLMNAQHHNIEQVLRDLSLTHPIVWFSRPTMLDLFDEIPTASLYIYHVVDEYSAYSQIDYNKKKTIQNKERKILKDADVVIVVSKSLYDSKKELNESIRYAQTGSSILAFELHLIAIASSRIP